MGAQTRPSTRSGRLALALLVLASVRAPLAHEAERTRVVLTLAADGGFVLEVANDPMWLLLRLETFAGGQVPAALTPTQRDARLAELTDVFADRIVLFVDAHEVRARAVTYHPPRDHADPPVATYRLTGTMPRDATRLRWLSGLVADPYPLEIRQPDGSSTVEWIEGTNWSGVIDLTRSFTRPTRTDIAGQYLRLGYTHILPKGLDHILFVIGLFLHPTTLRSRRGDPGLRSAGLAPLLLQVTAFTVAHSITLALAIYGIVALSARVVEPLIALSIAYVAVENLVTRELKPWRLGLVVGFGLLHGLGFAGVLHDLGLPRDEFVTALVTFNLGVEAGQLTVIAAALAVTAPLVRREWYRRRVAGPASVAMAAVGMYWTVARIVG
jgi:hypothetical protein